MASLMQKTILVFLIFTIAIPISMGHREKSERHRRHRSGKESDWKDDSEPEIARFTDTNSRNVADIVIDLAIAKSGEINDQLSQLYRDSGDDVLKRKYISCSKNYNDANRNLVIVRRNLNSDDFGGIPAEVDDVVEELKSCEHEFGGKSFDPAHIRDRNKEFGHYVEIVKAATHRFLLRANNA